jgi:hypothetical protein
MAGRLTWPLGNCAAVVQHNKQSPLQVELAVARPDASQSHAQIHCHALHCMFLFDVCYAPWCCQNSTVMWEKLPMALMAEVLQVHHTTLRSLLDKHNGYESATERDSFILAFHSPSDALAYAIEAQQCLLAASWPQELLADLEEARHIEASL